jgi:hypothetical protein
MRLIFLLLEEEEYHTDLPSMPLAVRSGDILLVEHCIIQMKKRVCDVFGLVDG